MGELIRLHNMVPRTKALGPGTRAVLWTQGCGRQCPGCMSPESRPVDGGRLVDTDRLAAELAALDGIEGVTVSGGEPFLQIGPLYSLLRALRVQTDLGVILYTGYTLEELEAFDDPRVDEICSGLVDLIVDGPYVEEQNDGGALRGSSNQRVLFLTERYVPYRALYEGTRRNVEILADKNGMLLIGVPARETLEGWRRISGGFAAPGGESFPQHTGMDG